MNYCNNQNWWLLLNATDPTGQLEWLIRELQASELIEEKVEIHTFINLLKLFLIKLNLKINCNNFSQT
jgi:hypothetical protein